MTFMLGYSSGAESGLKYREQNIGLRTFLYVCVRGGPNQPLHRDPQSFLYKLQ
jgi:hypothetical protein